MKYCCWLVAVALLCRCSDFGKEDKHETLQRSYAITNIEGEKIFSATAGTVLKITAAELEQFTYQNDFIKSARVLFDQTEATLLDAKGDYITVRVPVMNYADVRELILTLRYHTLWIRICLPCIKYTPTISATIFAGRGASEFNLPAEMTADASGNLYIIDQQEDGHDFIKKISNDGSSVVFSGTDKNFGRLVGIGIDESRNSLYVADASQQRIHRISLTSPSMITTFAGSGSPGNGDGIGLAASFRFGDEKVTTDHERGQGLTVDTMGNIFVGERYGTSSTHFSQIRKITPEGSVATVTGSKIASFEEDLSNLASPAGLTTTPTGQLAYVAGASTLFQGVIRITASGSTRLAGKVSYEELIDGTGNGAEFASPKAIHFYNGYYYVADGVNGALRRVSPAGTVVTLAGVGRNRTNTFCGCGWLEPLEGSYTIPMITPTPAEQLALARNIRMDQVGGIVGTPEGIYISDYGYKCIWKITIN